jgi:carbon monoxide dehydrogenase subunit G
MTLVRTAIEIAAPPERVWDVVMDPNRLGEWVTIHRSVDDVSQLPLTRGATFQQTLHLRGAPLHVAWTVDDLDAPRRAVWSGRGPAHSRAEIVYELSPSNAGTRFSYTNEFKPPGGPLGAVAGRMLVGGLSHREAERSLERLKRLVEQRQ